MDSEPMIPERDPDNSRISQRPKPKPRIQKVEQTTKKDFSKESGVKNMTERILIHQSIPNRQHRVMEFDNEAFSDDLSDSDINNSEKVLEAQKFKGDDRSSATFSIDSVSEIENSLKDDKVGEGDSTDNDEQVDYKNKIIEPLKDEYVSITMTSETEQEIPLESDYVTSSQRQDSIITKWKKGFKTFMKSTSTMSSSQDDNIMREVISSSMDNEEQYKSDKIQTKPKQQQRSPVKYNYKSRDEKPYQANIQKANELLGIIIHNTDLLPVDPHILHPVVKVTLMTEDGIYLTKTEIKESTNFTQRERQLSPRKLMHKEAVAYDYGRKDRIKEKTICIYPVMTQPLSFSKNDNALPLFSPAWEELLLIEEPFETFVNPELKVIAFFELMDFLPMEYQVPKWSKSYHGSEPGWYKIAWGFLKLVGSDGSLNCNHKVRLQLFKPEKLNRKEIEAGPTEVYCWWKLNKRSKYKSTLYVTIKEINPSDKAVGSIRMLLSMGKEELAEAIIQSQLQPKTTKHKKHRKSRGQPLELTEKESRTNLRQIPKWNRIEGQSCKIPNKHLMSLPSSSISSININVHGNVYCVKFSPCGLKLFAGLDTEELHAILVFEFPSGNLLKSFRGHYGLIYDLDLHGIVENPGEYPDIYLIASASGDSTARIWKLDDSVGDGHSGLIKTLPHPSFVYTIKFHPTHPNFVATGCFDYVIRFWDISRNGDNVHPYITLDRHYSFVNSIAFLPNGQYLFSGDGNGNVYKWKSSSSNPKKWRVEKHAKFSGVINNLVVHPNGKRILAHLRSNLLKVMDIETFLVLTTFNGLCNETFQIHSCFSPCGNMVFSGSEDTTVCIWDANTGKILQFISPKSHPRAIISSVSFHPYDNYLAMGLSSAISEPTPILIFGSQINIQPPKMGIPTLVQMKLDFQKRQQKNEQKYDQENLDITSQFVQKRGDSREKFRTIIKKLDEVTKSGQEKSKSMADIAQQVLAKQVKLQMDVPDLTQFPVPRPRRQQHVSSSSESTERFE